MKFLIANDIHLGSKHATHTYEQIIDLIVNSENIVVLNGDIVDMANCKKSETELWGSRLDTIVKTAWKCGRSFVSGNHELNQTLATNWTMLDGVMFNHGDYLFWSKEKADAYRAKKPGAGFLKRWFTPVYDHLRHLKDAGPNDNFYKAMDKIILEHDNMRAIVVGHRHPKENIVFDYKGVKCYILKRGIQELEI